MNTLEKGSICIKTAGRNSGEKVVILKLIDNTFVEIEGFKIKKKRCNISHLFPTRKKIDVSEKITQEELKTKLKWYHDWRKRSKKRNNP